jgi:dihydrofolate reductase
MVVAKTQYYTATSIDGFIADQGNSPEWPFQAVPSSGKEDRFSRFFTKVGAMAMGATTYEWVQGHERLIDDPVPPENRIRRVTCRSSGRQAARSYSLIRPLKIGFRRICHVSMSVTVAG